MWKKRYCAYTKKNVWCSKKATFHYQVKFFSFWFERNELWLRRFQTAVFRLTCCSNRCESTFQKTNDSWRKNRSWYKIFSRNRESKKFRSCASWTALCHCRYLETSAFYAYSQDRSAKQLVTLRFCISCKGY